MLSPAESLDEYERNEDDATHASLSALLPGATKPITLYDPVAGDTLLLKASRVAGLERVAELLRAEDAVKKN